MHLYFKASLLGTNCVIVEDNINFMCHLLSKYKIFHKLSRLLFLLFMPVDIILLLPYRVNDYQIGYSANSPNESSGKTQRQLNTFDDFSSGQ